MAIQDPPFSSSNLILGQAGPMSKEPLGFLQHDAENSPGISKWRLGPRNIIHISRPDYIKHVMQTNASNYIKNRGTQMLKFGVGNGLLTSEGDFGSSVEEPLSPFFHKQRIAGFVQTMADCVEDTLGQWESKRGHVFDLHHEMMTLTLDIISQTMVSSPDIKAMAPKIGEDVEFLLERLMKRVRTLFNLPYWVPVNGHQEMLKRRDWLRQLAQGFIDERRAKGKAGNDLLGMLMETVDGISQKEDDTQLIDELLTIFIAGHETTAVALSYMIYLLAQHPEALAKVKQEAQPLLANRSATFEDLAYLPYTKQVIQ